MGDNNVFGVTYNENWEERWKGTVSADFDYDSDFLIAIICKKLGLMREYFSSLNPDDYNREVNTDTDQKEVGLEEIVNQITYCAYLGNRILNHHYGEEADKFFKLNNYTFSDVIKNPDVTDKLLKLSDDATKERANDIELFFSKLGEYCMNWWG